MFFSKQLVKKLIDNFKSGSVPSPCVVISLVKGIIKLFCLQKTTCWIKARTQARTRREREREREIAIQTPVEQIFTWIVHWQKEAEREVECWCKCHHLTSWQTPETLSPNSGWKCTSGPGWSSTCCCWRARCSRPASKRFICCCYMYRQSPISSCFTKKPFSPVMQISEFDQHLECKAPKCWSKYTTGAYISSLYLM